MADFTDIPYLSEVSGGSYQREENDWPCFADKEIEAHREKMPGATWLRIR